MAMRGVRLGFEGFGFGLGVRFLAGGHDWVHGGSDWGTGGQFGSITYSSTFLVPALFSFR